MVTAIVIAMIAMISVAMGSMDDCVGIGDDGHSNVDSDSDSNGDGIMYFFGGKQALEL